MHKLEKETNFEEQNKAIMISKFADFIIYVTLQKRDVILRLSLATNAEVDLMTQVSQELCPKSQQSLPIRAPSVLLWRLSHPDLWPLTYANGTGDEKTFP